MLELQDMQPAAVAARLRAEAQRTCDDELAELLSVAAAMLTGKDCAVLDCGRPREIGTFCRPHYQAIRRKTHAIFDALQASAAGDSA